MVNPDYGIPRAFLIKYDTFNNVLSFHYRCQHMLMLSDEHGLKIHQEMPAIVEDRDLIGKYCTIRNLVYIIISISERHIMKED
jgi:hypothetical protein